jgi:hypothetical protein
MKQIKTIAFIAIAFSSFAFMSFTTSNSTPVHSKITNLIKVSWAKESHEFGEIPQGKPVSIEFVFTNNGDEPLLVADAVASCGCTASDYSKEPIMPGKSSKIKVTYNAANVGAFTKTVTVNFSDAASKKVLNIKGTVK